MKIKKIIAIALSLALGACMLTACSKDPAAVGDNDDLNDNEKPSISQPNGEYTITFDANGGTFGTSSIFTATTINGKLGVGVVPQNPTYNGYTFDMWTDASGKIFSLATTYTANVTYKAQWTANGNNTNNDNNDNNSNNNNNNDNNNDDNDPVSQDITFVFSTGWPDDITDVRIHVWGDEAYTDWNSETDIGGDYMSNNYDGTFSYTVTVDAYRGDVQGLVIMFTQEGKSWYAKSTDCTYYFTAGETYNLTFSDWNNDVYGAIDWDTWGLIPFDIYVS